MTRSSRRTTSLDVARAAGVSRTTVSFVLNDRPGQSIPEATRQRVLDAARLLDYRPHASARSLAAGRSDIVLLALPDLPIGQGISRLVEQLATALAGHGLTLVTHLMGASSKPLPDVCATVSASAVVGLGPFDDDTVQALHRAGAQLVLPTADDAPAMEQIGRLQAQHLIARGHRRLGYALPAHPGLLPMGHARLRGVEQVCAEAALPPPLVATTALDVDDAARIVRDWASHAVTGVCAFNDETAIAVLAGARACGLGSPAQLAVIGVDDIPTAALTVPALTTVAFDLHEVGHERATRIAAALTANVDASSTSITPPRVVTRAST